MLGTNRSQVESDRDYDREKVDEHADAKNKEWTVYEMPRTAAVLAVFLDVFRYFFLDELGIIDGLLRTVNAPV